MSPETLAVIKKMQQNEVTESHVYSALAKMTKGENSDILLRLSKEEAAHALIWQKYTNIEMKPDKFAVARRKFAARVCGFTFVIKLMERGEEGAQEIYETLSKEVPEAKKIEADENAHENALIGLLDEERLKYVGSMVLGLSDALVELTGTLAGLSFALQNTRLIALSGLITGIAATLSMASSEFLSAKSEGRADALKSCTYTGIAYLVTVALLILPYLLLPNEAFLWALAIMLVTAVLIILVFNYYISVAKEQPFKKRFFEMAGLSLGVAGLSFVIGIIVKQVLGVDV